jgi:hypothetical protein
MQEVLSTARGYHINGPSDVGKVFFLQDNDDEETLAHICCFPAQSPSLPSLDLQSSPQFQKKGLRLAGNFFC